MKQKIWIVLLFVLLFVLIFSNMYINLNTINEKQIKKKILDESIQLMLIENLLSSDDCEYLINKSDGHFLTSKVLSEIGGDEISNDRTSQSYFINENDYKIKEIKNKIFRFLSENIDKNKNWEKYTENTQIVKYEVGQQYKTHYDYFPNNYLLKINNNQRQYTIFIYLNDVDDGGETEFPNLGIKIKPKKGSALFWKNCNDPENCFANSLHQGLPPIVGKKYGMNVWMRFNEI